MILASKSGGWVQVDHETHAILKEALYYADETDGTKLEPRRDRQGHACGRIDELCRQRELASALFSLGASSMQALGAKPDASALLLNRGFRRILGRRKYVFSFVWVRTR